MNKKKNIIMLLVLIVSVGLLICFKTNTIKVEGKELYASSSIYSAPICHIHIVDTKVKVGKTISGVISCYDEYGLSDKIIEASDIKTTGLIKKVKLTSISKAYTYDGKTYQWDFTLKGTFIGTTSIELKAGTVSNISNNSNTTSLAKNLKVTLFK